MENLNNENNKDRLFEKQFASVKSFAFDQQVTDVFSDMIRRSVPGYETLLKSIAMYCMRYAQNDTNIYDLGCSLGAVAITAAEATKDKDCHIIGVDTSKPMLEKCQRLLDDKKLNNKISLHNTDIATLNIANASVIVSNFTLQFIPKQLRSLVVNNIFKGLNDGGLFILSEKFKGSNDSDSFLIDHYHAYKKINGYSNKEIHRKRKALQDVLIPDNIDEINKRLTSAGFSKVIKWFQCFNFASFIAIKE